MKGLSFIPLVLFVALFSCNSKSNSKLLSVNNLKSYFVTLNSDSSYSLKTPKGALMQISANTFDLPSNTRFQIEVKEAYSMQDILLAGLSTESNGRALRSAGMLYLKATFKGSDINFLKPIRAVIPAKFYDSSMQVFKSEIKDDSSINWVNPQPIDTSTVVRNLAIGKSLFRANCASCHNPLSEATGPSLAGARKRAPNVEWPYRFVNNSLVMLEKDPYARSLKAKYGSVKTQFNLAISDIRAILDYCDNEANLIPVSDSNLQTKPSSVNSCGYDTFYVSKPKEEIEISAFDESLMNAPAIIDSNSNSIDTSISQSYDENLTNDEFSKRGYKYVTPDQGIYQINIKESGWYNIDAFFDDPNATKVQLFAEIQSSEVIEMMVYLCIPKRKILVRADRHNNNVYLFNYADADGFLPMILNDDAYIFATASNKDKVYYGITKFRIKPAQSIKIIVKESSEEQILNAIKINQLDSIKIDFEKRDMEIIEKPCEQNQYPVSDSSKPVLVFSR